MSGPPPTPDETLQNRGSNRAGRRGEVPKLPRGKSPPRAPRWLRKDAQKIFRKAARILFNNGVLADLDGILELAKYCQAYARLVECEQWIEENGMTYVVRGRSPGKWTKRDENDGLGVAGEPKPGPIIAVKRFPQVIEARNLMQLTTSMADRLGLSPSARVRLASLPSTRKPSPKGKVLDGRSRFLRA